MHVRKTGIGFFTILMLLLVVVCVRANPLQQAPILESIPVSVFLEDTGEEITLWQGEPGEYFAFLPSHGTLSGITFRLSGGTAAINGIPLENGITCDSFLMGESYPITYEMGKTRLQGQITFLQSREIPAVFVRTNSASMAFVHGNKENEEPGQLRIYDADGQLDYSGRLDAIGGRGNATWELEKKPYNLTLVREGDLLGMGTAQNWVLLANAFDPTNLRNKIVCDTAMKAGMAYSPDSRWVDLYLNGEYAGLYLLCENNQVLPQRVDLPEDTGAMSSIEKRDRLWAYGSDQFITEGGIPVRIRHNAGDGQLLQQTVQAAERAILSPDGVDPETGNTWQELLDMESWAEKYLIEEIFGNLDAGSISQFFYWNTAGDDTKIYAGPVWDYDICMGNPNNWQLDVPQMLYSGRPHLWDPEDTPWFYCLYQKEPFRRQVAQLYETRFRPILQELLSGGIEEYADSIASSVEMNRVRWNMEDAAGAVEAMTEYMIRRMAFLDSLWLEKREYHSVLLYIQEHVMACYAVEHGAYLKEQPVPGGTDTIIYEAWCDSETNQPFDFSQPITGDKLIYLKETNLLNQGREEGGITLRALITYVPAAVLGLFLLGAFALDGIRAKGSRSPDKKRGGEHDRREEQKISS